MSSASAPEDFQLVSSVRCDSLALNFPWNSALNHGQPSPFMLLPYHFDRLRAAAALHGWQECLASLSWSSFQSTCQHAIQAYDGPANGGPFKLRLLLHRNGAITTNVSPVTPLSADPMVAARISSSMDCLPQSLGNPIALFLDRVPTTSSPFTATKTTCRGHYAAARARFGLPDIGGSADVLLWNTNGMVTETSIRNVAFFRRGRWITPHDSTGCLPGVIRRWLLEQGLLATDDRGWLTKDNVQEGELVLIFNAVEGCRIAVAHLRKV